MRSGKIIARMGPGTLLAELVGPETAFQCVPSYFNPWIISSEISSVPSIAESCREGDKCLKNNRVICLVMLLTTTLWPATSVFVERGIVRSFALISPWYESISLALFTMRSCISVTQHGHKYDAVTEETT